MFGILSANAAIIKEHDFSSVHELTTDTNKFSYPDKIVVKQNQTSSISPKKHSLSLRSLYNQPQLFSFIIDQAIRQRQWSLVKQLLPVYRTIKEHNPYLLWYAEAGINHLEHNYSDAFLALQNLLTVKPELDYVRLDFARMLVEDKQFVEARTEFQRLEKSRNPQIQHIAKEAIKQLDELFKTQWDISAYYSRNDNVNQASDIKTLYLWGVPFTKNEDSMPKSGQGITYSLMANKLISIKGHHYLNFEGSYSGTEYWDQKDYSESTLRLSPGYLYQKYNFSMKLSPFYEQNWLGGKNYNNHTGIDLSFMQKINDKQVIIPYFSYSYKHYNDPQLSEYEGRRYQIGITVAYQLTSAWRIFTGMDYQYDNLKSIVETSHTLAGRVGSRYQWQNGLGVQFNLRMAERKFAAHHTFFNKIRKDYDFSGTVAIWHDKLNYKGFMPKLVYQYRNVNSNIPELYSWDSKGMRLEISKSF
ncbi:surface lipoprotein assembly modifier [Gallibacterium melopsittaci]|uniref:Surface lipoprotein assembly modifier n=2 Tax=Gallibacterium melopsittaci TaxID=516063 RepID=A0ABV6HXJ2_9PAST